MFGFRWAWLRSDPEWLARAPELRDDFQRMREGFREWNLRAMPIMLVAALLFFLITKLLKSPCT